MSVSLICSCKNRIDALRVSLNSWVKFKEITEIIIVDWDSDESIDFLLSHDPRIKIIKVSDEKYFNQPQPLNLAADFATGEYILKVDCDYIINPYYNFFERYFPKDNEFVCGEYEHAVDESQFPEDYNYMLLGREGLIRYDKSYSPFYKYLIGLLFTKKENFDKINGYNELLHKYYAFEDEEIFKRLELSGLKKVKIDFDNFIIHIPHPDSKRVENFKGHVDYPHIRQEIYNNLKEIYSEEQVEWEVDYVLSTLHVSLNKEDIGKIDNFYIKRLHEWKLEEKYDRYFYAKKVNIMKKLEGFPIVNFISLKESKDRQENLIKQFEKNQVTKFNPLISKRFEQCDDIVTGSQVDILDSGTKGCVVSHIKMIKKWYDESDEKYGFFCEDDLSLESIKYWDFTWKEFIENLPDDADCVQLYCIRDEQRDLKFENRWQTDWSVTAYILTKEYAKRIIDQYYVSENEFNLEVYDTGWYPMPENVLFWGHGNVYSVNLFLEDLQLRTTFSQIDNGIKENHLDSYTYNLNWWKNNSKNNLNLIFGKNMEMKSSINKNNDEKYTQIILDIEELLTEYSSDTENPELNFKIGLWYEVHGQDAAALSFFLRAAERFENNHYAYESLIHGAYCYDRQGTRDMTAKGILQQALVLLPHRPEAYYHLSNFCRKRGMWQDCYIYASTALTFAIFDSIPTLKTDVHFPGKFALMYEQALAAWDWGKIEESYNILMDIKENYEIPEDYKVQVEKELEKFKNIEWFFTEQYRDILENLSCNENKNEETNTVNNDIGKIDIVLAGHFDEETPNIINSYLKLDFINNIILSTWKGQYDGSIDHDRVKIVEIEKPIPGTDNRNLQIASAHAGLELVTTEYCAKMRTDQRYYDESMLNMYNYLLNNREFEDQIFVAGIYPNLLFHPRDHVFWGKSCNVKELYDIPLEYNGLSDKIKISKENLHKYYPFFVRNETYIGARYCSKFDETINIMLLEPEKYLHDNCGGWNQSHQISQNVTTRAFKSFPREGIDLEWNRKGLQHYPYDDQKNGYGECWAEDF
jgi:GR25 family glycosyltransferase involved in LPS biosynthesis